MLVAQITDMHILAAGRLFHSPRRAIPESDPCWSHIDTARIWRAVAELNALKPLPDVTVVTGDLTDHGSADEYANLRELLAPLRMPYFLIPGNHDDRDVLREAFSDHGYFPRGGFLTTRSTTTRCASSPSIPWSTGCTTGSSTKGSSAGSTPR